MFTIITVADCLITYYNTPDLAMEANPLIAVLGLGWTALIISNLITLLVYSVLVYFSFAVYKTPVIEAESEEEFKKISKKTDGKGVTFAILGYAMAYSLIVARLMVVIEWLFITFGLPIFWYWNIRGLAFMGRIDVVVSIIIAILSAIVWTIRESKNKRKLAIIG